MTFETCWTLVALVCAALACAPARNAPSEPNVSRRSEAAGAGIERGARKPRVAVYASEGEQLHTLALDPDTGELLTVASISLPRQVHYAAADRAGRLLYVSSSDGAARHGLHAFRVDPDTGALSEHGPELAPPLGRIIHLSIDPAGAHLILAHNRAAQLSSVRLEPDGQLGSFVPQAAPAHTGFFAHQALLHPTGEWLVACGLGADGSDTAPEEPGSLTLFQHSRGQLTSRQTLLPGSGLGPRHLDYAGDHVHVVMERGNRLVTYRLREGQLEERPAFDAATLMHPERALPGQRAGAIHLHPSGRFLYVSNRASRQSSVLIAGQALQVFAGGANDIALFALEPGSGEPRPVDHYDTRGFEPRSFTIEPGGRFLIVANQSERNVIEPPPASNVPFAKLPEPGASAASGALRTVPRSLVVFEIGDDGRLHYRHEYTFTGGDLFWIGSLALPG